MDIPANAKHGIIRETLLRTDNLLNIKQLCSLAGVSRSGYYHYLSTEEDRQRGNSRTRKISVGLWRRISSEAMPKARGVSICG